MTNDQCKTGKEEEPAPPARVWLVIGHWSLVISAAVLAALYLAQPAAAQPANKPVVRVGAKAFVEGVILGQLCCHLIADGGGMPLYHDWLGDTGLVWNALLKGHVSVYCAH